MQVNLHLFSFYEIWKKNWPIKAGDFLILVAFKAGLNVIFLENLRIFLLHIYGFAVELTIESDQNWP